MTRERFLPVELYRRTLDSESVYVALGLSSDARMGSDLVTSCVSHNGQVSAATSWNSGHTNLPMVENVGQLRLVEGSLVEGELYCRLTLENYITGRPPLAGAETFHYWLDQSQSHHLLLAGGSSLSPRSITYHGPRLAQASEDRVQLSQLSHVHTKVRAQLIFTASFDLNHFYIKASFLLPSLFTNDIDLVIIVIHIFSGLSKVVFLQTSIPPCRSEISEPRVAA